MCGRIHDWNPEYAIKHVWPQVRCDAELHKYLPSKELDLGRWPDRRFFWGILSTLQSDWVKEYSRICGEKRDIIQRRGKMKARNLNLGKHWKVRLMEHDFASR